VDFFLALFTDEEDLDVLLALVAAADAFSPESLQSETNVSQSMLACQFMPLAPLMTDIEG